ncbi:hypothetical protein DYB28_014323 [Aphanomyces astaci]|uniref:Uncharacterized protein n=1 Tax=Aphanomyces astaci TaxID=112090 RepID=A0A397E6Y8_APHAT|nr:hypothetical protein DYB36_009954 [Aphanomyces astaci]RHY52791.1 hypothetical protein DYB38_010463 [Aphanomyces astaci]RHY58143.1 hypothetical protein DYB34_009921 [Aphanomyces astaci]RHY76798.1 hypothetical protein DYB30_013731 [Aphanomyces astaci]RHY83728.1 hypothetical protein DYB26_008405 [Aphanomyces astaci]
MSDWDSWGDDDNGAIDYPRSGDRVVSFKACCDLTVSDYLCPCGDCPQYLDIELCVQKCCLPPRAKIAVCRILQAYSTYNESRGFQLSMIRMAHKCLLQQRSEENAAFQAFVALVDP